MDFKYDVAFSFLAQDEHLANQLNDLLKGRLSTFIYSERQTELVGRDGSEAFAGVFAKEARIVVVLYRAGWGTTPFTRIEETAIKNRAFDQGYENFLVMIPLDSPPTVPPYIPKTVLWGNLQRYGISGVEAVIEARVNASGGKIREESLVEKAQRLQRTASLREDRERFLDSDAGVRAADQESSVLFEEIRRRVGVLQSEARVQMSIAPHRPDGIAVFGRWKQVSVSWERRFGNTLRDAVLRILVWPVGQLMRRNPEEPYYEEEFEFSSDDGGSYCWISGDRPVPYSNSQLADHCLEILLTYDHKPDEDEFPWS